MRKLMLSGTILMALSLILVLTGCSTTKPAATTTPIASPTSSPTSSPTTTPTTDHANVNISGLAFVPQTLTVSVGTTVTWTNNDSVSHTVTSNDDLFASGTIAKNATFSHTFEQKGTFNYHCSIHPSMTGKVIVE